MLHDDRRLHYLTYTGHCICNLLPGVIAGKKCFPFSIVATTIKPEANIPRRDRHRKKITRLTELSIILYIRQYPPWLPKPRSCKTLLSYHVLFFSFAEYLLCKLLDTKKAFVRRVPERALSLHIILRGSIIHLLLPPGFQ